MLSRVDCQIDEDQEPSLQNPLQTGTQGWSYGAPASEDADAACWIGTPNPKNSGPQNDCLTAGPRDHALFFFRCSASSCLSISRFIFRSLALVYLLATGSCLDFTLALLFRVVSLARLVQVPFQPRKLFIPVGAEAPCFLSD